MSKHIDLMEPIFFTPPNQPTHPVGGRRMFKGGGGGEREATAEEKRLWAAQADSLEKMTGIAMPNLFTGMNNLGQLTNNAMDGTLAAQMRNQAGADANVSLGSSLNDMKRIGGFDPSLRGGQDTMAQWGLGAAKQRLGAMNQAAMTAEDQKWQRNAALTGLSSGQGAQAIQGMGQLSGQLANNRQMGNNTAMQQQQNSNSSMQGLGMLGAYMMRSDGGYVGKSEPRFDGGGLVRFQHIQMPQIAPYAFQADDSGDMPSAAIGEPAKMVGSIMAANMAANAMDKMGISSAPKEAMEKAAAGLKEIRSGGFDAGKAQGAYDDALLNGSINVDDHIAGMNAVNDAANASIETMRGATSAAPYVAGAGAILDIANGRDAGESVADAALGYAGSEVGAAAGSVVPGIGTAIGAALGGLLGGSFLKDGGMPRQDFAMGGGGVRGPGTATSDSIPARLSDGEFVANAKTVAMGEKETEAVVKAWMKGKGGAKELLEMLNNAGLQKRYGSKAEPKNGRMPTGKPMKRGGLARRGC